MKEYIKLFPLKITRSVSGSNNGRYSGLYNEVIITNYWIIVIIVVKHLYIFLKPVHPCYHICITFP